MQEKRLAIFLATSGHSGVDRIMVNLMSDCIRRGLAVDLLQVDGHGPRSDKVPAGVKRIELGTRHVNSSLPAVVRYLKNHCPSAMLTDKDRVNRLALIAAKVSGGDTRIVVRVGTTVSVNLARRGKVHRFLQYQSIRRLYPLAHAIIVPSQGAAVDLARIGRLPLSRIRVLPSPVIDPSLDHLAGDPQPLTGLQADPHTPLILAAGELCARKDFATLVRAVATLRHRIPVRLVILGRGRQKQYLTDLARQLGIAEFLSMPGFVANPFAYMRKAAVFVLSSRCEGAPVVLMEALALGIPVVSTDCPSGPRELLDNGRLGALVPVGDADRLAQAIYQTLVSPPDPNTLIKAATPYRVATATEGYLEVLGLNRHNPLCGRSE